MLIMWLYIFYIVFSTLDMFTWSRPTVHGVKPGARDGHSACVINNKMYIFGGYEEAVS